MPQRLELMGVPGSPYTRKMLALLRYRHIPYSVIWAGYRVPPEGYPRPKVKLLPTVFFPETDGSLTPAVDSTPIIRRLEKDYAGRAALPVDPELQFYCDLIEDYADEWLTKPMFHYRWYHAPDRANAGPMIAYWSVNTSPRQDAEAFSDQITKTQFERLYVVGSNEVTARTIEDSYIRFLRILDVLLQIRGYVLGARPSAADFAIYGQLTQLGVIEPTSAAIMARDFPRVRAWVDLVEDLSGLKSNGAEWFSPEEARAALGPLLSEIGRVYIPFLLANAAAAERSDGSLSAEIDGRTWTQPTFPYQVKCLEALRNSVASLPESPKQAVAAVLALAGCAGLSL
ncbi:glutathione S-transferase N-terminal domain-containing protein [Hyphomonas sp.]|uniref:glutathione S-transferase N-terminal domain-containing protein n=1 Tax=Hyphomonas sp. TaxID=87 RepID=UPI0025C35404|nr:glutathione S-transferase N-terminal domain-containing protein [Hyphomonas sp.]MBI1401369.1 glutathione S-transferase [Hyphomonas sp.]